MARPIRLGFLGAWPFRSQSPHLRLLDSLGFPWILSSESRLINGLQGTNRPVFFAFVLGGSRRRDGSQQLGLREDRIVHALSLNGFLILCNELSALIALGVGRLLPARVSPRSLDGGSFNTYRYESQEITLPDSFPVDRQSHLLVCSVSSWPMETISPMRRVPCKARSAARLGSLVL